MRNFKEKLCIVEIWITSIFISLLILLNMAEVLSRYVFNYSLFWVSDMSLLLFTWIAFLGTDIYFHLKRHVSVDYFVKNLSGFWRDILNLSMICVVCIFCLVLALGSIKYFIAQKGMVTEALHIPNMLFTLPLFIFAVSNLLEFVLDLKDFLQNVISGGLGNRKDYLVKAESIGDHQ